MTRRIAALLTVVAACGWATCGCSPGGAEVQSVGCRRDSDCPGVDSMQCFDRRICLVRDSASWEVVMRVAPGPGSGLVEEYFDVTLEGGRPTASTWQLTTPATVRGRVKMAKPEASLSELIPGTLIATAEGALPGTMLRYTATSLLHPRRRETKGQATAGRPAGSGALQSSFDLMVSPGHDYNIAFWPKSAELPPHYAGLVIGGDIDDYTLELPVAPDKVMVRGRIVSRPAASGLCDPSKGPLPRPACDATTCNPVSGLRVALQDSAGHQRSTRVATGADGTFVLAVPTAVDSLWLAFDAAPSGIDGSQPLSRADKRRLALPSGRFSARIDLAALPESAQSELELGDLDLGPLPGNYLLVREVLGEHGLDLAGARVRLRQRLAAPLRCVKVQGSGGWNEVPAINGYELNRSTLTGPDGQVKMRVLQAPGGLWVRPSANSSSAAWTAPEGLLPPTADPIRCGARRRLTGTTADHRQRPIHGATVIVQPLTDPAAPERSLTPIFTTSDESARFGLWLDPGRYAMIVDPPAGSGLARAVADVIVVKAPSEADDKPMDVTLKVVPPTVHFGRILGARGAPLAGVLVDVLAPGIKKLTGLADPTSPAMRLIRQQTHLLGSTVTDADGRFEVLVAPGQLE